VPPFRLEIQTRADPGAQIHPGLQHGVRIISVRPPAPGPRA
jgi:hypothetical protein